MKLFLFILLLSPVGLSIDRPYNHWAVYSVKCDEAACYENPKVLFDVQSPVEALKLFQQQYPDADVRCIARDYYYFACSSRW